MPVDYKYILFNIKKMDYIYLIKLIKQIKYIIPLQKQIKLITKYFFLNFNYMYHKRTTITFLSKLKKNPS
jgi:hypothetical protein